MKRARGREQSPESRTGPEPKNQKSTYRVQLGAGRGRVRQAESRDHQNQISNAGELQSINRADNLAEVIKLITDVN